MAYKFIEGKRISDWVIYCSICTNKLWASESNLLSQETGRGGLRVCPDCNDQVDFGLIPYKVPAEKPAVVVNYLLPNAPSTYSTAQYPPFNYETFNPLDTPPDDLLK